MSRVGEVQGIAVEDAGDAVALVFPSLQPVVNALWRLVEASSTREMRRLVPYAKDMLESGSRGTGQKHFELPAVAVISLSTDQARVLADLLQEGSAYVASMQDGEPPLPAFIPETVGPVAVDVVKDERDGQWYVVAQAEKTFYSRLPATQALALVALLRVVTDGPLALRPRTR